MTSGAVYKSDSVRLGMDVFDVLSQTLENKKKEMEETNRKNRLKYNSAVAEANKIFEKKSDIKQMTLRELTIICKQHKTKADGAMPKKKRRSNCKVLTMEGASCSFFFRIRS